jgi:hypothetical protein
MTSLMGAHPRGLTPAQSRILLAMQAGRTCDAWSLSKRLTTLYELEARGLIRQGKRGWLDAALTEAGRAMRTELLTSYDYRDAAE